MSKINVIWEFLEPTRPCYNRTEIKDKIHYIHNECLINKTEYDVVNDLFDAHDTELNRELMLDEKDSKTIHLKIKSNYIYVKPTNYTSYTITPYYIYDNSKLFEHYDDIKNLLNQITPEFFTDEPTHMYNNEIHMSNYIKLQQFLNHNSDSLGRQNEAKCLMSLCSAIGKCIIEKSPYDYLTAFKFIK